MPRVLVEGVRELDRDGASLEEIAVWMRERVELFTYNGKLLAEARGITMRDAFALLGDTEVWRDAPTSYELVLPDGSESAHGSLDGCRYAVGDRLYLPLRPDAPFDKVNDGGWIQWVVRSVGPPMDPARTARLEVEPLPAPAS